MDPISFRIRIGVTGHRKDLPESNLLKNKIREVLGMNEWNKNKMIKEKSVFSLFDTASINELRKAKNTPVTFCILTALAEGSDRIVADTVLEIKDSTLKAVLPLSEDDYLEDFKTNESKDEFERILKLDYNPARLRKQNLKDQYKPEEIPGKREQAYFNAGKYIVDHCDVLIGIWDGEKAKGKGGTADVIKYAEDNNRAVIVISSKDPVDITTPANYILNAGAITQIEFFNTYNIKPESEEKYVTNIYKEYFLNEKIITESKILNTGLLDSLRKNLFPYYVKSSTIAKKYQLHFKRSGLLAYWLSTLAVSVLIFAVVFKLFYQEAFILEFFILFTILVIISRAHRIRAHTKWLENRFLTERLRIAPYFFISGQEVSEVTVSPYREQRNEAGQWMILAFSEIWDQLNRQWYAKNNQQAIYQPFSMDLVKYVDKSWVEGQISHHEGNVKNKKWWLRSKKWWNNFLELGGKLIFFAAMMSAVVHIIIHRSGNEDLHSIENLLTVLALSLPLIAAAFEGVRRQKEYSRNAKRSEWMIDALNAMSKKYKKLIEEKNVAGDNENEFYALLKDTDKLMLHENQDWMMLMIQSELEYVT